MKNERTYWITTLILLSLFFGCKKVIDVSVKNAPSQIVITGEITNRRGPYKVNLSRSVNFSADNIFPPVSGALVVVKGNGVTDTLSEDEPGIYFTNKIEGTPGKSYSLYVVVDGKTFTATSSMPEPVRIDSLSFLVGRNDNIYPVVNFQDPAGIANYYQFIEYANGEKFKNGRGNSVFDDRLSDGRYISTVLYDDDSTDIRRGIVLTVQMNCVDKPVYDYLEQLLPISGGGAGFSSPAPANPTTNINGGALGYFSAHTITTKSVQLPK